MFFCYQFQKSLFCISIPLDQYYSLGIAIEKVLAYNISFVYTEHLFILYIELCIEDIESCIVYRDIERTTIYRTIQSMYIFIYM